MQCCSDFLCDAYSYSILSIHNIEGTLDILLPSLNKTIISGIFDLLYVRSYNLYGCNYSYHSKTCFCPPWTVSLYIIKMYFIIMIFWSHMQQAIYGYIAVSQRCLYKKKWYAKQITLGVKSSRSIRSNIVNSYLYDMWHNLNCYAMQT